MKDVKPTCTVVDSYGPEESLPDSNEPNDSYDGLSASQTSDGEALSDSDDQIGSRLDTYLHSDLSTRPKQIEAIDEGIPTSTREPGLFRYDCSTEAASIIDAGVGVRSPGLIDGWEPRSTVTFNVTDTAGQEIAILDHASNSVGKLRDPHHDQKRELDSICSINLGLNYKIYRWRLGSTITYNVNIGSFLSQELAAHASKCLEEAARQWNRGNVGVQFQKVADGEKAVFQLEYSIIDEGNRTRLAHAFMPGPQWSLQKFWVYKLAFNKDCCSSMTNIFCHELGHCYEPVPRYSGIRVLRGFPCLLAVLVEIRSKLSLFVREAWSPLPISSMRLK
ncbi:hypothetical protein F5Y02DRAFT_121566 [Annulohypoxylon stygium]|nr:hypothetical protein F5Y02DRAFT_121566 [Annulohypoxylon stygium]